MVNWLLIIGVVIVLESVTLFCRFGLKKTSSNMHQLLMKYTNLKKIPHLHHLYTGIIIALVSSFLGLIILIDIGIGIAISDLTHHGILKVINNDSEFNLMYKKKN